MKWYFALCNDCRRIKDLFLYVIICHGFFFLNSSFLNVPQKKASIVRKPNNMLKTKKMPDFASSAKFRQKVKNMLCLLNYNKNFVSTIDKAWIMKAIIIVIVLMIVIWGHWLFYYHSNSIQRRALRDWAERGRGLLTNVSITHGQQREAELHFYTLRGKWL